MLVSRRIDYCAPLRAHLAGYIEREFYCVECLLEARTGYGSEYNPTFVADYLRLIAIDGSRANSGSPKS